MTETVGLASGCRVLVSEAFIFPLSVAAKMEYRDSRGKENANNRWKVALSREPTR